MKRKEIWFDTKVTTIIIKLLYSQMFLMFENHHKSKFSVENDRIESFSSDAIAVEQMQTVRPKATTDGETLRL